MDIDIKFLQMHDGSVAAYRGSYKKIPTLGIFILLHTPVGTRRRFDVHTSSITLKQRRTDVKTTSCAYWDVKDASLNCMIR